MSRWRLRRMREQAARRTPLAKRLREKRRNQAKGDDKKPISETAKEAREDLLAFTKYTFPGDYNVNWHHRKAAAKLDAFAKGKIKRLILSMPPRYGKSELASRRLPAYILGRDPDNKIIACSYEADLAKDMSRDCKRIIMSDEYKEVFPDTKLPSTHVVTDARYAYKNTADHWQIYGHKGHYICRGVGGGITGKGANFLLLDDPIKDDIKAQSKRERDKLWRWYTKVFKTRAAKDAGILIIMTRWHQDDIVGRLKKKAKESSHADQWEEVRFPALYPGPELASEADEREEEDEPLWEYKHSKQDLVSLKRDDPEGFQALYQQQPTAPGGNIYKRGWFNERYRVLPDLQGQWLQMWDLRGGGEGNNTSYAVGQLWVRFYKRPGLIWLVDQKRGKWGPTDSAQMVKDMATAPLWRRAGLTRVERKADGVFTLDALKAIVPGIEAYKPAGRSKRDRWGAVTSFWRNGNVMIPDPEVKPWVHDFIEEHTSVPTATNDDQVDCSSAAIETFFIDYPISAASDDDIGLA